MRDALAEVEALRDAVVEGVPRELREPEDVTETLLESDAAALVVEDEDTHALCEGLPDDDDVPESVARLERVKRADADTDAHADRVAEAELQEEEEGEALGDLVIEEELDAVSVRKLVREGLAEVETVEVMIEVAL